MTTATNGNGDAYAAELRRHIRVLEHYLPPPDDAVVTMVQGIHAAIGRLDVDHRERHTKLLGVLTDVLTKLNEVIEAQNRTTQQFTLLLAGMRLAPAPQSPPTPPRKSAKAKPIKVTKRGG